MALEIRDLVRPAAGAMYVSPARICVTAEGELVDEDDPRAVTLLVAKGGEIPIDEARQYGLVDDEALAVDPASEIPGTLEDTDAGDDGDTDAGTVDDAAEEPKPKPARTRKPKS